MNEHMTFLSARSSARGSSRGISSTLPPALVAQIPGRVAMLAGLIVVAFGIEWILLASIWAWSWATGQTPALAVSVDITPLRLVNAAVLVVAVGVWLVARRPGLRARDAHLLGLVFVVIVCYVAAAGGLWQHFVDHGHLPAVTWVPALVMLLPILLPGPPTRMLVAAVIAGASVPAVLVVLHVSGRVDGDIEASVGAVVGAAVAIGVAHVGARTIYGLGRDAMVSREFGSYRLEEKLGEGGMGEVWRAQHRLLARPAAVKLIRGVHALHDAVAVSEDAIRRFEREARATASLRSPHTVQLFDFGVSTDGAFYYAMELLDGLTLEALVQRYGPLPAERVIHVLQQMCHSLSEASWRGLVHRDIKPSNVVLCHYGEDCDFVKILDFGIVRSAASGQDATLATRDDVVQGTPAFMSPEQVLGTSLDGRTDIYATGCVAYWMLTGQLVFEAESLMALAAHHVHTPPTPPSSRTELPIPPALDALVMDCLAKDPMNRPTSARELSRRLSAVELGHAWSDARAREWWSAHQPGRAA